MCVVSNITDYGQRNDLFPWSTPVVPMTPGIQPGRIPAPPPSLSPEEIAKVKEFLKLIEQAKKFDEATGQPECPDPGKLAWLEQLENRVKDLEEKTQTSGPQFLQE